MFDWRGALLRRLARRFHIGDDILRHLSTFQRLGQRFEIEAPAEMLPVGARTLARALRTRAAPQIRPDWVWPYWLQRQLDPTSPSFVPRGHLPFATNMTHRNWTAVGNPGSPWEAIVDPAGLVTPAPDSWSLDWWVGTGDGTWVLPSQLRAPEQRLAGGVPIVETVVRLGDDSEAPEAAVQRVYATKDAGGEVVVVEVDNTSDRPLEIAFALRPYNPEGLAVVEDLRVERDRILADGAPAVLLPEPPERVAASTYLDGDCLHQVTSGARGEPPVSVHDPAGLAQAAAVYRLAPGERVVAGVPLAPGPASRTRHTAAAATVRAADSGEVRRRWQRDLDRGMRVRLPDRGLQEAVDANRAYLLLLHDPGSITAGPATYHRFWFRDAAYQVVALDRWGLHEEAADVLVSYPDRQRHDGFFYSQWREWDANGAAIWAIAEHHRLTGDEELLRRLLPCVRRGVNWIDRTRREHRTERGELRGLLPAGVSAEHLGPFDYYYWDDFWCLRGLVDGAELAEHAGNAQAAAAIRATAEEFRADILASIEAALAGEDERFIPAGPYRGVDAGMIGSLVACAPLRLLDPDDPLVAGTVDQIRRRYTLGDAFYQAIAHTGLGTYLTLQLAFVELARHDPVAWRRVRWLLDVATPTHTWPEAIHPRMGGGCMGDGHHGWAAADLLNVMREVLVTEDRQDGLALLPVLPPEWRGQEVEVREAPTHAGRLSYRLWWEGTTPCLEWQWHDRHDRHEGRGRLRAPGLDPGWSTTEPVGKVRLAGADSSSSSRSRT
ncbi:hypothetical protein SAMN05421810_10811 [Amycolatopsis arida]|uniref:Alpha-L-rhamnosidase n=1 Tax=Amycolatopsis arida TaxID=587909 RepID=A0A1I5YVQ9_9PSEU|nr:hypothetical protein [Amycolatopsis arida]TDX89924.1 hypothetical protein CLV69_10811 [Amycolatopsis arida]SFQ48326.1 hypothetical protein SAMN05421810_10811 [Amycolatopsis arida]